MGWFIKFCLLALFSTSVCKASRLENALLQWKYLIIESHPAEAKQLGVRYHSKHKQLNLEAFGERRPIVEELLWEEVEKAAKDLSRSGPHVYGRLKDETLTLHPPITLSPVEVPQNTHESQANARLSYVCLHRDLGNEPTGTLIIYPGSFPLDEWHLQGNLDDQSLQTNPSAQRRTKKKLVLHGSLIDQLQSLHLSARQLRTKLRPGWRNPPHHEPLYHLKGKIDHNKQFVLERIATETISRMIIGARPGIWHNTQDLALVRGTLMKEDAQLYVLSASQVKHPIEIRTDPNLSSAVSFTDRISQQLHLKEVMVQGLESTTVAFGQPVIYVYPDHKDISFIQSTQGSCSLLDET